jgi:heme-degrading monooxygenase HmoA
MAIGKALTPVTLYRLDGVELGRFAACNASPDWPKILLELVHIRGRQEDAMSIIRLIHIKIDPSETETAERIWKTECATLMIAQKGCISEQLLRARDRGEFISYSEWETEADIERYMGSAAHKEIVSHTRGVKGASAVVKLYDLVN